MTEINTDDINLSDEEIDQFSQEQIDRLSGIKEENTSIFLVELKMSSPFRGTGWDDDLDEYLRHIKYLKGKKERTQIGAVRQSINVSKMKRGMKYFKSWFVTGTGLKKLKIRTDKADQKMKAIDSTLKVSIEYIKLDSPFLNSGNMSQKITGMINTQINQRVLSRIEVIIEKKEGRLTQKSKDALLKMVDQLKQINLMGDQGINSQLENMKNKIIGDQLEELKNEIVMTLEESRDRFSSLEYSVPEKKVKKPQEKVKTPSSLEKRINLEDL